MREGRLVARLVGVRAGADLASRAAYGIAAAIKCAADGHRAARATVAGADAVVGVELACSLDGERLVLRHIDTRIIVIESPHGVLRAVLQDDGGVALAGELVRGGAAFR